MRLGPFNSNLERQAKPVANTIPCHLFNIASAFLPSRSHGFRARLLQLCGVRLGRNVRVNAGVRVYGGFVRIGDETWLSPEVVIFSGDGAEVSIGHRCDVGPAACFITGTHEVGGPMRRAGKGYCAGVVVGDGCWIGTRATILGGARIGAGSIVGAGAVVLAGEYPANSMLAGVPASVKRELCG